MKPTHYLIAAMALAIAGLLAALAISQKKHAEDITAWAIERAELADAKTTATEKVRTLETQLNAANLENANEQARLKADAARRIADANRAAASLRDTIATLRSRDRPADPTTASWFDAASIARQLVGECSDRRQEVAQAADGLRTQVIGLQRYVAEVCQASKS